MMISKIRTGIKSKWSRGLLLFLFVALFGGFGMMAVLRKVLSGTTDGVALVNGFEVSKVTFARKKRDLQKRISGIYKMYGQMAPYILAQMGLDPDPEKGAMKEVIQEALINQAADKVPVFLSQDFVALKFKDPYFLIEKIYHLMPQNIIGKGGKINLEAFNQFLATYDLGPIEQDLEASLHQEVLLTLVGNSSWAPDFVINAMYKSRVLAKKFTIVTLPLDHFIKEEEKKGAKPGAVKAFFDDQNKKSKRYYIPARRMGTKWVFEPGDFTLSMSEKEIENFYNKVKRSRFIDAPTQVKIREIVFDDVKNVGLHELKKQAEKVRQEALQDPSAFAALAEKHSSAGTAKQGGLVDFFKRGTKEKALERIAFVTLKKDGDISEVIPLEKGYVLVQRVARKDATYKPLSKVKEEVKETLQQKKFATEFQRAASRLVRSNSENAQQRFNDFVEKNKGKEEKIPAITKEETPESPRLFSIKKAGDKIAYLSEGKGVVLQLTGKTKREVLPFEMVEKTIAQHFYEERARKELAKEIEAQKSTAVKEGKLTIPSWAHSKKTEWIKNEDQNELKKYREQGIPLDFLLLDKEGGVLGQMGKNDGFIVQLNEFKELDKDKEQEEKNKLKTALLDEFRKMTMQAFIASLNRNATIEITSSSDSGSDI